MPSLSPNDRLSLCRFTFADGRQCRTPRVAANPNFCFYHAQKEAQSQAVAKLAADLSFIFSGTYVSANDLSAALSRLVPAVLLGHIKPRTARTLAYMIQTLLQTIRLSQHEFINTFGSKTWRKAVAHSVNANRCRTFPPNPDVGANVGTEVQADTARNLEPNAGANVSANVRANGEADVRADVSADVAAGFSPSRVATGGCRASRPSPAPSGHRDGARAATTAQSQPPAHSSTAAATTSAFANPPLAVGAQHAAPHPGDHGSLRAPRL
ncbi:MAG TPA: hypothetical protein VE077_00265 [Candidatus Methylomirabilis sp.]|nr:hypothetical protein [Candidatus Methylomirabilis sp.]